jgi:hypothetical protein
MSKRAADDPLLISSSPSSLIDSDNNTVPNISKRLRPNDTSVSSLPTTIATVSMDDKTDYNTRGYIIMKEYLTHDVMTALQRECDRLQLARHHHHDDHNDDNDPLVNELKDSGCVIEAIPSGSINDTHMARTNSDHYMSIRQHSVTTAANIPPKTSQETDSKHDATSTSSLASSDSTIISRFIFSDSLRQTILAITGSVYPFDDFTHNVFQL